METDEHFKGNPTSSLSFFMVTFHMCDGKDLGDFRKLEIDEALVITAMARRREVFHLEPS